MDGANGRLDLVRTNHSPAEGAPQQRDTPVDLLGVPQSAILMLEGDEVPGLVNTGAPS